MRSVYVTRPGASLRRQGQRLQVCVGRKCEEEIPAHDLEQLVLMGNIVLTPAAVDLIVDRGIDTVYLTLHGRYRARIVHGLSSNVRLRLAQYRRLTDEAETLALARTVVRGKAANQRAVLLRHRRRHGDTDALRRAEAAIRASVARLEEAEDLDAVRGCEGAAAAAYFRVFGALLRSEDFHFDHRNRRPPLDPVNVLLSFGYTLLSNVVEAAVNVVGLDPYLGALHAPAAGRPSLVCDLEEEFRAPVVDALVLAAIHQRAFKREDFEEVGPGEPVHMKPEAARWLVTLFERRMERPVRYPPLGDRFPYRKVIELQVRRLARHLLGADTYECFTVR